jgi:hypothetical protein
LKAFDWERFFFKRLSPATRALNIFALLTQQLTAGLFPIVRCADFEIDPVATAPGSVTIRFYATLFPSTLDCEFY